jgi:Kef-type K+ transport system membrane component KefB
MPPEKTSRSGTLIAYASMLAIAGFTFWLLEGRGAELVAPPPAPGVPLFEGGSEKSDPHVLMHVLLALVVVIIAARLVGALFKKLQQPAVIGEVLAGIMLGPSVLGAISPATMAYLMPPGVAPFLGIIAQVGVVLFMFLVGIELDTTLLRKRTTASVAVSHASIVTPFVLGALLSLLLYPKLSTSDVPFLVFALVLGVSMSVTAFPVLARILTDRRMQKSELGVIALTCAAVDDVTAWCLLALVVSVARSQFGGALLTMALSVGFVGFMLVVVRPVLARAFNEKRQGPVQLTQMHMAFVFMGLLFSALATEAIGIHALFGAFLFGAIIPHDSSLGREVADKLTDVVVVLLLPAFFAFTGMRTAIGLVDGLEHWLLVGLIIVVASVGKFGGSFAAARLVGLETRKAAALGVLMNTRGLMELIVLNVGLDLRVVSPTLFAMLVIMAVVTTMATSPILSFIMRPSREPVPRGSDPASLAP